jgi:hypothetical protein
LHLKHLHALTQTHSQKYISYLKNREY